MVSKDALVGEKISPFLVIFTDLDGTLLDSETYSWRDAENALAHCRHRNIPIVIATSKTRSEVVEITKNLGLADPFITENGGGVFFPKQKFTSPPEGSDSVDNLWRWSLGAPHETLKKALKEIAREMGLEIRGFSDMGPDEISQQTGLDHVHALLAQAREYDEPFVVEHLNKEQEKALFAAATRKGLQITRGGRFYHLHGNSNKGLAAKRLITWYEKMMGRVYTIAVGDSPNDLPLLEVVDQGIFVGDPDILNSQKPRLDTLIVTPMKGPRGWAQGISEFLTKIDRGAS